MVVIVSSKVSPLLIELSFTATFIKSAPNLLAATSKLVRVLVESSKKRLKIVRPSSISNIFIRILINEIYFYDSFNICSISLLVKAFVSTK